MKKMLFSLTALMVVLIGFGTGTSLAEEETLLKAGKVTHGGFGGPVVKFSQINYGLGVLAGGRGGWIINHTFVIGAGGYGLTTPLESDEEDDLSFGYGGLEFEYIILSDKLVHLTIYTLLGGGGVSLPANQDEDTSGEGFFIFEPAVNAELNVTKFFRVGLGLGYRMVVGDEIYGLAAMDLSGVTGTLILKFGSF